jgi:2-polyprenyl-6-methoxyphenol hydroxylase-like FAD-dependent oxidoreductase
VDRKRIGIIGAGVAGLHLGLHLRQHGVDAVILTDTRPEDYRGARLQNTVAHHHGTLALERALGIDHWPVEQCGYFAHYHYFGGEFPLAFRGHPTAAGRSVDYRIYLPQLMADFAERGGVIEYGAIAEHDVPALVQRFDLIVVCTGRTPLGRLFARDARHSPLEKPQRSLQAGLFTGIRGQEPRGVMLSIAPGHGELVELPILSFGGPVTGLLLENLPGGDFEELQHLRYEDDPRRFRETFLAKLATHHPLIHERIDAQSFDLCSPRDQLQGAITAVVREGHRPLGDEKWAIALGDAHVTVDPALGQGANAAAYAAAILGEEIVRQDIFDERFCEEVDARRMDRILCAARWTQRMLEPPSAELRQLIAVMSQNQALLDAFSDGFSRPDLQWRRLGTPARILRWIAEAQAAA